MAGFAPRTRKKRSSFSLDQGEPAVPQTARQSTGPTIPKTASRHRPAPTHDLPVELKDLSVTPRKRPASLQKRQTSHRNVCHPTGPPCHLSKPSCDPTGTQCHPTERNLPVAARERPTGPSCHPTQPSCPTTGPSCHPTNDRPVTPQKRHAAPAYVPATPQERPITPHIC